MEQNKPTTPTETQQPATKATVPDGSPSGKALRSQPKKKGPSPLAAARNKAKQLEEQLGEKDTALRNFRHENADLRTANERLLQQVQELQTAYDQVLHDGKEYRTKYEALLAATKSTKSTGPDAPSDGEATVPDGSPSGKALRDQLAALQKEHTDLLARYNQQQTEATKSFTDRARLRDDLHSLEIHSKANEDYIEWLLARPLWQRITNRR